MKSMLILTLLFVPIFLTSVSCSSEEAAEPAVVGEQTPESPAEGSVTTQTPNAEEGSGTIEGEKSTATKTGEAVGGAVKTAGEATEKGVKTGIDATVKGAQAAGEAAKEAVEGTANAIKGEEKKN